MRLNNFNAIRVCRRLTAGILIPVLSIFISINASASETDAANDTTTKALKEFVVEAKKETHTDEGLMIYLSKENKRFGTNALDAISSLRQFTPTINGTSLATASNKSVAIIINGVPSTALDLRGYTGNEVQKITYYEVAPARYSDITTGPLVEVVVKVRKDSIYAFISADNSVNTGYGTNQALVRWADSLNLVRADYFIDYRNLKYNGSDNYQFLSNPGQNRDYAYNKKHSGHFQYGRLQWQNISHGNILNLALQINHENGNQNYNNTLVNAGDDVPSEDGNYTRKLHSSATSGNLDAFFRKKFGRQRLDIQFSTKIEKSSSDNNILEETVSDTYSTDYDNRLLSFFGKLQYYIPVRKNNVYLTASYSHNRNNREMTLPSYLKYHTTIQNARFSASASRTFRFGNRRFTYNAWLRAVYLNTYYGKGDKRIEGWNFSPYLSLSTLLSDRVYLRVYGNIYQGNPTIGQLSDIPTYQFQGLAWSGNPNLKRWTHYTVCFQPDLTIIRNYLRLNGDFSYSYRSNPIMDCVYDGDPVEIKSTNLNYLKEAEATMFLSIFPIRWLTITPYFEWTHSRYDTPSRHISKGYFRGGGSIAFNTEKLQAKLSINSPSKVFNGDIMDYAGWQMAATVLYKLPKDFTVSLAWHHSYQNDKTEIYSPGVFMNTSRVCVPRQKNQISIALTWSFNHGVYRKRTEAQLDETDSDNGFTDYNRAKP